MTKGTPQWVSNRIPKHLGSKCIYYIRKELMKEYHNLTPEERLATVFPNRRS